MQNRDPEPKARKGEVAEERCLRTCHSEVKNYGKDRSVAFYLRDCPYPLVGVFPDQGERFDFSRATSTMSFRS